MLVRPPLGMDCPVQIIHTKPFPFLFHLDITGSKGDFCRDEGVLLFRDLENKCGTYTKDFSRKCL